MKLLLHPTTGVDWSTGQTFSSHPVLWDCWIIWMLWWNLQQKVFSLLKTCTITLNVLNMNKGVLTITYLFIFTPRCCSFSPQTRRPLNVSKTPQGMFSNRTLTFIFLNNQLMDFVWFVQCEKLPVLLELQYCLTAFCVFFRKFFER